MTDSQSSKTGSLLLDKNGDVELQQFLGHGNGQSDGEDGEDDEDDEEVGPSASTGVNTRLYISHFLSTWNSRVFEFGGVLFIAKAFPGTLLPVSLYAVVRSASAIILSPMVGRYIDLNDRLEVVRISIVGQRLSVTLSCIIFWILFMLPDHSVLLQNFLLGVLALLACTEKLGSIMNILAVERDWVVVIATAEGNEFALQVLNSQMRRIDLFCKLIGPLVISIIDGLATQIALLVTLGLTLVSVGIEYLAIAQVYRRVPALSLSSTSSTKERLNSQQSNAEVADQPEGSSVSSIRSNLSNFLLYFRHRAFLPSIALSLLYFTVLSFAGQMVTYLLSVGYNSTQIGSIRTVSVAFEVSATWLGPMLMARIGVIRAGLWSISWQILCIMTAVVLFLAVQQPFVAAFGLITGVVGSRLGLWVFDLCVQNIIQEEVEPDCRGSFSSTEASFQNFFELCSYASTIVFAEPAQFKYPVLLSSAATIVAGALYAKCVRDRRGHLLHMSKCLEVRQRSKSHSWRYTAFSGSNL